MSTIKIDTAAIRKKDDVKVKFNRYDTKQLLPLWKKVVAMNKNECVIVQISNKSTAYTIQKYLDREFGKGKYKSCQRTVNGKIHALIEEV